MKATNDWFEVAFYVHLLTDQREFRTGNQSLMATQAGHQPFQISGLAIQPPGLLYDRNEGFDFGVDAPYQIHASLQSSHPELPYPTNSSV